MTLGRDEFRKLKERRYKSVNIEGFGEVRFRSLTENERGEIGRQILASTKNGMMTLAEERAYVLCYSLVDDEGNRLFHDKEVDEIKDWDGGTVQAIYDAIDEFTQVSLVRDEERIEDAAKN